MNAENAQFKTVVAEQVSGPGTRLANGEISQPKIDGASFSTIANISGHGKMLVTVNNPLIQAGSRIVASAAEFRTQWNVDRKIGSADIEVYNVAPTNGSVQLWVNIDWGSVIPVCITLFIDP